MRSPCASARAKGPAKNLSGCGEQSLTPVPHAPSGKRALYDKTTAGRQPCEPVMLHCSLSEAEAMAEPSLMRDEVWRLRAAAQQSGFRAGGKFFVEQFGHTVCAGELFFDPACFDRSQDAGDFGSGADPARDDLAALQRQLRNLPTG